MGVKACPDCGGSVAQSAKQCIHCGSTKVRPVHKASFIGALPFIVLTVPCLIAVFKVSNAPTTAVEVKEPEKHDPAKEAIRYSSTAQVYCKEVAKAKLRAPSTAKFERWAQAKPLGKSVYAYSLYVDSQNGFGAMIRSDIYCKVKCSESNSCDLIDFKMEGK